MKKSIISNLAIMAFSSASVFATVPNTPPSPVVISAAMRPGTTLMDVVYRVNDPDNATVKVRALAFVNGSRSFANVIRPVTFVEGTGTNLGDSIDANTDYTLTWDVAADWNIDLGQIKFEILARDTRGLLDIDWITIPAAGGEPEITLSKNTPGNVTDALFWQYAAGDPALTLENGILRGNANSGVFEGVELGPYAAPYVFKLMNLDPEDSSVVSYAGSALRSGLSAGWHVANEPYTGIAPIVAWGTYNNLNNNPPAGLTHPIAIAAGNNHSIALNHDGTVFQWDWSGSVPSPPAGLTDVTAIASGDAHSLALKADGTVVAWGNNNQGQLSVPAGLTDVIAIAAGSDGSLALKSDSTIINWGNGTGNSSLTNVIDIKFYGQTGLALKDDGTVVGWGSNNWILSIPAGLTDVSAISVGQNHALALKSDGTVVGWGQDYYGQATPPTGLTGVEAIASGSNHNLALKSDGTVVGWGRNNYGQATPPPGLTGFTAIAAGSGSNSMAIKAKAP